MAEASDLERTEPASPRRLEQARERGQVPRSPELSTFAVLMAAGGGLVLMGASLADTLARMMRAGLTLDRAAAFDTAQLSTRLVDAAAGALFGFAPWFALVLLVASLAPMLLGGGLVSFQTLQPDYARLDPLRGLFRIFSWYGAVELAKVLLRSVLVGGIAVAVIWTDRAELTGLLSEPVRPGLAHLAHLLGVTFLMIAGGLALIAAIDVPFQIWDHARQLRMTREEIRQELAETEGDPRLKARIRNLQRDIARRPVVAGVLEADVVVTSPNQCAVALKFTEGRMRVPRVVAKGTAQVARRIVELARAHDIAALSAPPLARALLAHAPIGQEIPAALYNAVAEVLAWVYQLRRHQSAGAARPQPPSNLPVPPELDPRSGSAAGPAPAAA